MPFPVEGGGRRGCQRSADPAVELVGLIRCWWMASWVTDTCDRDGIVDHPSSGRRCCCTWNGAVDRWTVTDEHGAAVHQLAQIDIGMWATRRSRGCARRHRATDVDHIEAELEPRRGRWAPSARRYVPADDWRCGPAGRRGPRTWLPGSLDAAASWRGRWCRCARRRPRPPASAAGRWTHRRGCTSPPSCRLPLGQRRR